MKNQFEYDTVEIHQVNPNDAREGYTIKAPTFECVATDSLNQVLKAFPNILQEEDKGGWETYGVSILGKSIILMVRKPLRRILVAGGFG